MADTAQSLQTKEQVSKLSDPALVTATPSVKVGVSSEDEGNGDEEEEEEGKEAEEEDRDLYPYGKNYQQITEDTLKEISLKIGRIGIYWPEQLVSVDKLYPESYYQHSNKEKILLWYAENFRRQYQYKYKERKPLVLALDNECGIQKMVCTTIRPTSAHFPEFGAWDGIAKFVADYLQYEPLEDPTSLFIGSECGGEL